VADRPEQESPQQETPEQRRRRLAAVFGDVLPETTSDEREPGETEGRSGDDWLRAQVPPHHGG
jgi:hypothetical protein